VSSMQQSNSRDVLVWGALAAVLAATGCSTDSGGGNDASGDGNGLGPDGGSGGSSSRSGSSGGSGGSSTSSSSSGVGPGSGGSSSGGSGGSGGASPDATIPRLYDGTVGMACKMSADCEPAGGVGVNVCSNSAFGEGPLWPTAVCLLMRCDPVGSASGTLPYCDGPAADPTSPGVCLPTTTPAQPGMGICLPKCEFAVDGGAPAGCQGKDVCNAAGTGTTASGGVVGVGYCFGGCTADSDCPAGSQCQLDEGTCLTTLYSRTKMLGQGCTSADSATNNHACFCDYSAATNEGYCTQSCIVGGAPCPSGYVCGTGETEQLTVAGAEGGTVPGFTLQNAGMAGLCRAACPGSGDAGSPCPPHSSCVTGDTVGPICAP